MYKVIITPQAERQYKRISPSEKPKIKKKLSILEKKPLTGKKLLGEFAKLRSLRAWPYRIIYFINEREKTVFIVSILHRKEAYK